MAKRIIKLLTRSNDKITQDRAERISRAVENAGKAQLMKIQSRIDQIEDKKERMLDMSADNQTTTRNAIEDLEAEGFIKKYNEYNQELFILNRELTIAKEGYDELMGEDESSETDQS